MDGISAGGLPAKLKLYLEEKNMKCLVLDHNEVRVQMSKMLLSAVAEVYAPTNSWRQQDFIDQCIEKEEKFDLVVIGSTFWMDEAQDSLYNFAQPVWLYFNFSEIRKFCHEKTMWFFLPIEGTGMCNQVEFVAKYYDYHIVPSADDLLTACKLYLPPA